MIQNVSVNTTFDVAMKYGQQLAFAYNNNTAVSSLEQLDGRVCILSEAGGF